MRRCKIAPPGCKAPGKPCCADCGDKTCQSRCWNTPQRCGCWEEGPPPRSRGARRGPPRQVDALKVAWLYSRGLSKAEIARRLGCHRNSVVRILREMEANKSGNH